ncbi:helix-turn-helix domain-containing protein [Duganella radicis]|uniref:Helix-turn-helix domain-containing protein n=1 Tax=Duganella radicis TaxID=551988 RepID=A0A6L6PCZ4_9BURK|nr:helix-turn-helix domain-containing protein [Duganella radicis]MTV36962.1 helix-turn-helix domain-containing protein [Duganella radicis]
MATAFGDVSISTSSAGYRDRTAFWLTSVERLLIRLESGGDGEQLDATLQGRDFGLFRAASIAANRHAVERTADSIRHDGRDALFVCLMQKGRGFTHQGVECVMHGPGDIVIYDTTRPYGHGFPEDMAMTVLAIPRGVFEPELGPWPPGKLLKIDHGDGPAGWCAQAILRIFESEQVPRPERAAQILTLLGAALRVSRDELRVSRSTLGSLWRAKEYIRQNLSADDLSAESVGRAIGLSARQLSRIFELDGTSVARHVWQMRLARCRDDLLSDQLRHVAVGDIAFRWGFNHLAHFSRSYKRRFGEAPSVTRQRKLAVTL